MYQHTFSTPFHSLNTQPSVCCIHLSDIIPIGDSLKFPPPLPSSLLLSQFPDTSPLNKKGWMKLGAGVVVLKRTTISYLSTASMATSESVLLQLPPAPLPVRFGEISLRLDHWTIERNPYLSIRQVSHPRWIWSYLRSLVTFSCERRAFTCDLTFLSWMKCGFHWFISSRVF